MTQVKVQYAKTHLSALLKAVEQGEEIVIERGDQPVARLVPLVDVTHHPRELGFVTLEVPDAFLAPLDEHDLAAWEGR